MAINPNELKFTHPLAPLAGLSRVACQKCKKKRAYYCYDCLIPVHQGVHPDRSLRLPLDLYLLKHPLELNSKSTGVAAAVIAENARVVTYPEEPDLDPATTLLVFPSEDSDTLDEVANLEDYRNVVLIESTWQQSKQILRGEKIKQYRNVQLGKYRSLFWRHQDCSEEFLATIEAVYYFYREYHTEMVKRRPPPREPEGEPKRAKKDEEYDGRYDDLLFFFSHNYLQIQKRYREDRSLTYHTRHFDGYIKYDETDHGGKDKRVLPMNKENLEKCSQHLRQGGLVSFATETVYGLGAHALDSTAVERVFTTKNRPGTDPLIVHVDQASAAQPLVDLGGDGRAEEIFRALGEKFWPGPLTIVARAAEVVPNSVTAGTGFVGVRCPKHPCAQSLLKTSGLPVAAPSANVFGHISPTSADHVWSDLGGRDPELLILDGGESSIGLESTVVKLHTDNASGNARLTILRRGAVSAQEMRDQLGRHDQLSAVEVHEIAPHHVPAKESKGEEAPGQALTHYAPNVPTFMLEGDGGSDVEALTWKLKPTGADAGKTYPLAETIIIDYGGRLERFKDKCLAYFELSPSGNPEEAGAGLFKQLREAECFRCARAGVSIQEQNGGTPAQAIVVPCLVRAGEQEKGGAPPLLWAIDDRLFRSCSGRRATLQPDSSTS